jgi:hypothetical protein
VAKIPAIPDPGEALAVIETLPGDATTDYGAPSIAASVEAEPLVGDELERQVAVLQACWAFFDQIEARVSPNLLKGPRGGGRDRDKVVQHTIESEGGYGRYLGLKRLANAIEERTTQREVIVAALREHGPAGSAPGKSWPVRCVVRRMAWHVLDHAWEMEDKDLTEEVGVQS